MLAKELITLLQKNPEAEVLITTHNGFKDVVYEIESTVLVKEGDILNFSGLSLSFSDSVSDDMICEVDVFAITSLVI